MHIQYTNTQRSSYIYSVITYSQISHINSQFIQHFIDIFRYEYDIRIDIYVYNI